MQKGMSLGVLTFMMSQKFSVYVRVSVLGTGLVVGIAYFVVSVSPTAFFLTLKAFSIDYDKRW